MDTRTGELIEADKLPQVPTKERKHFVRVHRDVTLHEEAARQIGVYSPCGCGSGKKFKFCCFRKAPAEPAQADLPV